MARHHYLWASLVCYTFYDAKSGYSDARQDWGNGHGRLRQQIHQRSSATIDAI